MSKKANSLIDEQVIKQHHLKYIVGKELPFTNSDEQLLMRRGYQLTTKIGEGTHSKVYLAEYTIKDDQNTKVKMACKVIRVHDILDETYEKFVRRELKILTKLKHPYIIHVYNIMFNTNNSKCFIFMRHAENGDLLEFIIERGRVPEPQAKIWQRQLCLAIQYLHTMNIAHRDLKCENALLTNNYNIKIADFGFSRSTNDEFGKPIRSETFCGSLCYVAPEILSGQAYYPKRVDVWALGVIMYVMLNKKMPYDEKNVRKLVKRQMSKDWKMRASIADKVSKESKQLLNQLLEPDVHRRITVDEALRSTWFYVNGQSQSLSVAEYEALERSKEDAKTFIV